MSEQASETQISSVMEDPVAQTVARTYADALLGASKSVGAENAIEELESFLDDVLAKNPQFRQTLTSGVTNRDEKVDLIDRAIAPHCSEFFANFLRVVARKERLDLLPQILVQTRKLHEERSGKQKVQVTTAVDLSDDQKKMIFDRLNSKLPFEPILDVVVDPSVMGGLIIRVGDTIHDSSLRTRLKQLKSGLRERSLNEIQSGRDRFSHSEGN